MEAVIALNTKKYKRWLYYGLLVFTILSLIPLGVVAASSWGGYVSEKLLGMSGVSNSNILIEMGTVGQSLFDIIMGSSEGEASPDWNADSTAFQLNSLIPMVMMGMLIIMLVAVFAKGELGSISGILMVAILIYIFYAFFPSIQGMITGLLGGS